MSATRLAARIAAREARRRPFRSLLVIALVALPVIGMTVATTLIRTDHRTALEQWDDEYGQADLILPGDPSTVADAQERLPEGSRTLRQEYTYQPVRDAHHRAYLSNLATDLDDPMWSGRFELVDGRHPLGGGEVALDEALAEDFGVAAGDTLELVRPDVSLDVVGVVRDRTCVRCESMFSAPGAPFPLGFTHGGSSLLVDLPGIPSAEELETEYTSAQDLRSEQMRPVPGLLVYEDDRTTESIRWSIVVGALALAVVGIVIAAAFAVSARQQLVVLGQLSANGASEQILRRVLFLQGTATGVVGSVAGIGGGLVLLSVGRGFVEGYLNRHVTGFDVFLTDLMFIAAVGTVGASLAALVPARTAARIPTLQALAGRRPLGRVPRRVTVTGATTAVAGLALLAVAAVGASAGTSGSVWAAVAILGGLAVLFGATGVTPAMVGLLEPVAHRTRGVVRIATRSLARNRPRTGAVVAAVAAAGALAIGGTAAARTANVADHTLLADGVVVWSVTHYQDPSTPDEPATRMGPAPAGARSRLAEALPEADVVTVPAVDHSFEAVGVEPGYGYADGRALVVDDALADAIQLSSEAQKILADTGAVIIRYERLPDIDVTLTFGESEPVETQAVFSRYSVPHGSATYVSPDLVQRLGLRTTAGPVVATDPDGLDEIQQFDLDELRLELWDSEDTSGVGTASSQSIDFRSWPDEQVAEGLQVLLAGVSVLFALGVVGIGLALAAADERDERSILSVAGAGPSTVARSTAAKAWILSTSGLLLAIPMGFLPVATVVTANSDNDRLLFPFDTVVTLLVLVPIVAAVAALGASTTGQRLRPLRISTASFE